MFRSFHALILLAACALAGCKMEASITVRPHAATPDFVVSYDQGKTACVKGLTITAVNEGKRVDVWALRRPDTAPCTDRFTYGVVPTGYEVVIPPHPLVRGRRYEVTASGIGWGASQAFGVP